MAGEDQARFVGRSMQWREDHRLLTGRGQFVADLILPGMHAVFVRSHISVAMAAESCWRSDGEPTGSLIGTW